LFSLPHTAIWENYLFYIYSGSNVLYKFDLESHEKEGLLLVPTHADISETELTGNVFEQIKKYAESAKFYRVIGNDELILLYYQNGGRSSDKHDFRHKNTFVIAYSPATNEILCDTPMNIVGSYNNPTFYENGILYYLRDGLSSGIMESKASFLKYKFETN
jgi:hypothetical protein